MARLEGGIGEEVTGGPPVYNGVMQAPGLLRGLLLLLLLAAVLFTFNQTRLLARDLATRRLGASRLLADQVQAEAETRLLTDLKRLAAEPAVRDALPAGDIAAVAASARAHGLGPGATIQVVSVGETLRVVTSGPFNPRTLWEAMRGALERGEGTGVEQNEQSGGLALVAAARAPATDGTTAAIAMARPLDDAFVDAVKAATGLETSLYSPDGVRRATTLKDDEGDRLEGEPAAGVVWRRWERRQRPFVTASASRATAVDPIRDRHGAVIGVRELTTPLAYNDAIRRLPTSHRFLLELLFLGLAALMAALLGRGGREG